MEDCIFCKIAQGKTDTKFVYESDLVVAFMSNMPINPGHVLVAPKVHQPDFYELPDKDYVDLMNAVKKIATTLKVVYKPTKVGELIAGWDIPHTHVHVLPMHDYHDITSKKMLEEEIEVAPAEGLLAEAAKIVVSLD